MKIRNLRLLAIFGILSLGSISALAWNIQDSLAHQPPDSVATADSVRIFFLPGIGSLLPERDTSGFSASRFLWTDAATAGDLLKLQHGMFLRRLGSAGQPDLLSVGGIDWRGIAILMDGRPMNDLLTGTENLYDLPLEFIDHVELFTGPASFLYSLNGSGATINAVTRQYNTGRPITKVRFSQGPNEHLLTDAFFTQNVLRRMNLMIGIQRQVSDERFFNSAYDSWIVRSRLRYNFSDRFNMSLSDFYRRSVTGMNGGVLFDSTRALGNDPFNEAEAVVGTRLGSQTQTRRDVTLAAIGALLPDTSWTTKASLYYSTSEREYRDSASAGVERWSWTLAGGSLQQILNFKPLSLVLGGQAERRAVTQRSLSLTKTYAAWYGNLAVDIGSVAEPSVFARGESYGEGRSFSYGGSVSLHPLMSLDLGASYARFVRFPSMQETLWGSYQFNSPSLNLLERHTLMELSAAFRLGTVFRSTAVLSKRTVRNALVFTPATSSSLFPIIRVTPEITITQVSGRAEIQWSAFLVAGGLTSTDIKEQASSSSFPRLILTGEITYSGELLNGALQTRLGLRSRFVSRHDGVRFLPSPMVSAENTAAPLQSFSTVDLFGVFNIGDAFINLTWENILDKQYMTVYPYPELGRNVRLSINWIFLD